MNRVNKPKRSAEFLLLALLAGAGSITLSGCEEGAFEEAGEELDQAADEAEDALD